ncbi:hypothetical protein MUP32_02560 [Candidatus Microgenomates bacterium]|nr:hypothetical protein [Candidatus Microgenomates bacterium]
MAKIFLDTNYFIDIIEQRKTIEIEQFRSHSLYLSPLSIHIYVYLYKLKIPNGKLEKLLDYFTVIPIDEKITINSLEGPTIDFEDNLQLHSAAVSECDYFLTSDKSLLTSRFFGKVQILKNLQA